MYRRLPTKPPIDPNSVPPEKPTIVDMSAPEPSGEMSTTRPHDEGQRVVLRCQSQGGYPRPTLTWWRDDKQVDASFEQVDLQAASRDTSHTEPEEARGDDDDDDQRDDDQLPESGKRAAAKLIRNTLEVGPLTSADLFANYTCIARNSDLAPAPSASIMIDMNRKYPRPPGHD